jgi:hypothetical protein
VRKLALPSGRSDFSTLAVIMTEAPERIGHFAPKFEFEGDIANTADLERWVEKKSAEGDQE